ncbi:MAG: AlpA family phage regulatory protein [Gemmatimonadota bacterium]|nr:AlpA family phage regulatory protein [Gemmatimonadota bacterium]
MRDGRPDEGTKPATRFLRISEVQARTSLGRSTIYRWSAEGRFPAPVMLGGRVARWVEAEVDEWARKWLEKGRGGSAPAAGRN